MASWYSMRFAIVDDLEPERTLLKERLARQLRQRGTEAELLEFDSGEAFLAAEKERRFTAAFLDIYMEGLSGMDAARELRKTDTDCLLVFTTTSTDHALEGFQVRAFHYLVKPFSETELSGLLDEMLSKLPRPEPILTVKVEWRRVLFGGLAAVLALLLRGAPVGLRALLLAVCPWLCTGFLHLDGYMDVCDAVLSLRDLATRQRILKDSHCGAFAVICMVLLAMGQWSLFLAAEDVSWLALLLIPAATRACAGLAVLGLRPMGTSQYAAITALKDCDGEIERMRNEYNMRRRLVVKSFNDMGLSCFEPRGAFYAFPCIKSSGMTSEEFCTKLLEQKHVAIIPGNAFGASGEGYARVSYAYSVEHLMEALRRIREFLSENGK